MLYLTQRERVTLTGLGVVALVGVAADWWLQRRAPLQIVDDPMIDAASWDGTLQQARQVDLNRATPEELERLPEVGPSMAARIVAYRQQHGPFQAPEQVQRVPGIGPKTYEALKEHITVR